MPIHRSVLSIVTLAAIAFYCREAEADLYTSYQPTIEWLVDSCEAIYLYDGGSSESEAQAPTWTASKLTAGPPPTLEMLGPIESKKRGRWLVFLRRGEQHWERVRSVNLDHPLAMSSTSAITVNEQVLDSAISILEAVQTRINENHRLPADARPGENETVVRGGSYRLERSDRDYFAPVKRRLGAVCWTTTIETWDRTDATEQIKECDMLVTGLIVPADAAQRLRALADVRSFLDAPVAEWRRSPSALKNQIWSLANYRDPEVRAILSEVASMESSSETSVIVGWCGPIASQILNYWAYTDSRANPQNESLSGQWKLEWDAPPVNYEPAGRERWIELNLNPDHSFSYSHILRLRSESDPQSKGPWAGYWFATDDQLHLRPYRQQFENRFPHLPGAFDLDRNGPNQTGPIATEASMNWRAEQVGDATDPE